MGNGADTVGELRTWAEGQLENFRTILIGIDGNNGLRGEIKDLRNRQERIDKDVQALRKWGEDKIVELWHEKRPVECLGLEALTKQEKAMEARLAAVDSKADQVTKIVQIIETTRRENPATLLAVIGTGVFSIAVALIGRLP
jgi:hypothetical protein